MDAYRRFLRERASQARPLVPSAAAPAGVAERRGGAVAAEGDEARRLAARIAAAAWARAIVTNPRVVYLDTETTGTGATAEAIEVAVVAGDGDLVFATLLKPRHPIPPATIAVHGITDADVAAAPTLPEVYPALRDAIAGRVVVVYNAPFDRRLIEQTCRFHGAEPPPAHYECAMRSYAGFAGVPGSGGGGWRWHPLERAVRAFGEQPGGHRAAADARACRAVVHGMAAWFVAAAVR